MLSLYLLLDAPRIRDLTLALVKPAHRKHVALIESEVVRVFGSYLRGQLLLALVMFVFTTIALTALGLPYAWLLGAFAGATELIPVLGPIIGAAPALLLAAAQPFPMVLWVFLVFVFIQQVEAHILGPRISAHAVGLRPLIVMLALLVGLQLGGLLGALFVVPLAGVIWALASATFIASNIPMVEAVVVAVEKVEAKVAAAAEERAEAKAESKAESVAVAEVKAEVKEAEKLVEAGVSTPAVAAQVVATQDQAVAKKVRAARTERKAQKKQVTKETKTSSKKARVSKSRSL